MKKGCILLLPCPLKCTVIEQVFCLHNQSYLNVLNCVESEIFDLLYISTKHVQDFLFKRLDLVLETFKNSMTFLLDFVFE